MVEIDLEIRMLLMRARPKLSLAHADSLIRGVACGCLDVQDDAIACQEVEQQDFVTFCHVDGVALAAVFRKATVEFFAFAADESFIHDAEHLAMVEIQEFMKLARSRYLVPDEGLAFSMSQAFPWMEQHRKSKRDGESKRVA